MSDVLVIGYGNTLRRDDGAGPWVAEQVAAMLGSAAHCITAQQLLPELADELAQARMVFFVDAAQDAAALQMREVTAADHALPGTHASSPAALLALAAALYGSAPRAWLISVPAEDFDHGDGLSPRTQEQAAAAVHWLVEACTAPN